MFTCRFLGRFLAFFNRSDKTSVPLTIEASFLVIGRMLALRLICCCKGTKNNDAKQAFLCFILEIFQMLKCNLFSIMYQCTIVPLRKSNCTQNETCYIILYIIL